MWCAAAAWWEGGFRHLELLLSHQGTAPGSACALPVLCLCTPSGQHPQLLDGGSCWEAAASWWFQLSSPGPRAADGTQGLAHSHEASPITCLEVTSTESVVIWQEWRAVWFGKGFQNGPRQSGFGRGSSGLGNGGAKKSLLVPGSCPDCPQSVS